MADFKKRPQNILSPYLCSLGMPSHTTWGLTRQWDTGDLDTSGDLKSACTLGSAFLLLLKHCHMKNESEIAWWRMTEHVEKNWGPPPTACRCQNVSEAIPDQQAPSGLASAAEAAADHRGMREPSQDPQNCSAKPSHRTVCEINGGTQQEVTNAPGPPCPLQMW